MQPQIGEMAKDLTITFRIEGTLKDLIEKAAEKEGLSVTGFITREMFHSAHRTMKKKPEDRKAHHGVPSWFRATCHEATRGGAIGYDRAGGALLRALPVETPRGLEEEEWQNEVSLLEEKLNQDDDAGALAWFDQHFPKCMQLVPLRRRAQFIKGVVEQYMESGIDW